MENRLDENKTSEESGTSPEARASRLRRLRNLANFSRKELCERADIKPDTLIGWEVSRHGGLTENGAKKIIACVTKEGVQCTIDWLLYDIGSGPTIFPDFNKVKSNLQEKTESYDTKTNDKKLIIEELLLFRSQYRDSIDYIVEDDSMMPQYSPGEYVAGVKRYKHNIPFITDHDCIVQLIDGKILLRHLRVGSSQHKYTLLCTNIKTTATTPVLYDVELVFAAPVIWIRKKNPKN